MAKTEALQQHSKTNSSTTLTEASPSEKQAQSINVRRFFFLLVPCFVIFLFFLTQQNFIRVHQSYFIEDRQNISLQFSDLSDTWTEKTLRKKFANMPINCYPNPGEGLGDLACVLDTKSFNNIPALFISFFFTANRLQQISVNVPWWEHQAAYNYLRTSLGEPSTSQYLPHGGIQLHGWQLPDGAAIFYNRDKSFNPLMWNTILWRSASSCAFNSCFVHPDQNENRLGTVGQ